MTEKEWQARMDKCETKSELDYLLRVKPKGAKAVRSGGFGVRPVAGNTPLLDRLTSKRARKRK